MTPKIDGDITQELVPRDAVRVRIGAGDVELEGAVVLNGVDVELLQGLVVILAQCRSHIDYFPAEGEGQGLHSREGHFEVDVVQERARIVLHDDVVQDHASRHDGGNN